MQYQTQESLDDYGRQSETVDARGTITRYAYNNATGGVTQRVDDAETTSSVNEDFALFTAAAGQQNLVTDYECDNHGRVLKEFGPVHEAQVRVDESTLEALMVRTVKYTVYRDDLHQVWKATGYARGDGPDYTFVTVGTVNLTCRDDAGRVTDEIEAVRASDTGPLSYAEAFLRQRWHRWTHRIYDAWGQLRALRVYHLIPESGDGERNVNYNETCYGYDAMGRQNREMSPGGTISRTVYDVRSLPVSYWVGTSDAGATDTDPTGGGTLGNNMVVVLLKEYDHGQDGGDGLLTKETKPVDSDSANDRVTEYTYDFRGRRVDTISTDGIHFFVSRNLYDNMDRSIGVDTYHSSVADENLTSRKRWYYDNKGRVYREEIYAVDPEDGSNWVALVGEKWYDPNGNLIKEIKPGSEAITVLSYDNIGREVMRYLAYAPASVGSSSSSDTSSEHSSENSDSSSSFPYSISSGMFSSGSQSSTSESDSDSSSSSSRSSSSSMGSSSSSVEPPQSDSSTSSDSSHSYSSELPPPGSSSFYRPSSSSRMSSVSSKSSERDSSSYIWPSSYYSSRSSVTPPCDCAADGEPASCPISRHPVRYSNGQIVLDETDLSTRGFAGWAHTRSYGNLLVGESPVHNGNLWMVLQLSNLVFDVGENDNCIVATRGANTSLWFQPDGVGGWRSMFGLKNSLVHDSAGHRFILTTPEGQRYIYFDDSIEVPAPLQGRLENYIDSYGLVIAMQYNENYQMVRLNQTDGFQYNDFVYQYLGPSAGTNEGQLERVTLEINGVPVRQALYRYYGENQSGGCTRDLQQVTIREYNTLTSAWQTIRRQAYRYYTTNGGGACRHGMKYELGPESYSRMVSAGIDPLTASESDWAFYADKYFEYDQARRVIREDVLGGRRSFLFNYQTNPENPGYEDYNIWSSKTRELSPDGSIITVYANKAGRSILNKLESSDGDEWFDYFHYNEQGRIDLRAMPSGIANVVEPDDANQDLIVNLKSHEGLIKLQLYYPTTNPYTGAVATYLESEGIQKGEDGVLIRTRRLTYATHTVDGVSIHPIASEEVFPVAGEPGVITHYQFSWYGSSSGESLMLGHASAFYPGQEAELEDLIVVEQIRTTWNEASQQILSTEWQRFEDTAGTGPLHGPEGPTPKARRSYKAQWFDGAGRLVATADYGTCGGLLLTRPSIAPARSDIVLVSTTHYKEDGEASATIDANGIETRWQNDAAGRRIRLIENYRIGLGAGSSDANRTTEYAYAPDGGLCRLTLINTVTGDQVTRWEFGTTLADSSVARSNLMRMKIFPSGTNVVYTCGELSTGAQRITYGYNRQGQIIEMTDPNGTVHAYDFDHLGRPTQDRVIELATNIDGTVRRIQTSYESKRSLKSKVTSYNDPQPEQGVILNEVAFDYDELTNLIADRQAHAGPVTPETPSVLYKNETGWSNSARRQYIIYPNGLRLLDYDYGPEGGADDRLSRVRSLKIEGEDVDTCRYTYMGLSRYVEIAYPQPSVHLSYRKAPTAPMGDAGDVYNGYDRFGRTVDMRWLQGVDDATVLDRIQYGYNRASNRTWRRNLAAASGGQDQAWTYDGLSQVKSGTLGTLNINQTAIGGIPAQAESWDYDPTGNWQRWQQMQAGETLIDQTRVHNRDNQITQLDGSSEGILYDPAGNTLLIPPDANGSWTTPQALVWDAWNRLMIVKEADGKPISQHAYDGLYRRVMKLSPTELRHYYYNDQWKCVEERTAEPPVSSSSEMSLASSFSSEEPPYSSSSEDHWSSSSVPLHSSSYQSWYHSSYQSWRHSSSYNSWRHSSSYQSWRHSSSWQSWHYSSSYQPPYSWSYPSSIMETPPGPIAYYRCNETGSEDNLLNFFVDSEEFVIHGSAGSTSGKCREARRLNTSGPGSGWFSAESSLIFNPGANNPLFISFWFKPESFSGNVLVSKPGEYQIRLLGNGGVIFSLSTTGSGWDKEVQLDYNLSIGQWYLLQAWIVPGSQMGVSLDYNGTSSFLELTSGQHAWQGGSAICLGKESVAGSSFSSLSSDDLLAGFNGAIDEIAFFNSNLDDGQREALFNNGYGLYYGFSGWGPCEYDLLRAPSKRAPAQTIAPWLMVVNDTEATVTSQYVWGARPGHRDELILRDRTTAASLDERLWCLMDYYDPTSIVNNAGEVVERYQFSAFGLRNILAPDFSPRATSDYGWDFAFKGQFLDVDTGYYNYGYRYYSHELGRWLSRDPIGETGGSHLYGLVGNNPSNKTDHLGLFFDYKCGKCYYTGNYEIVEKSNFWEVIQNYQMGKRGYDAWTVTIYTTCDCEKKCAHATGGYNTLHEEQFREVLSFPKFESVDSTGFDIMLESLRRAYKEVFDVDLFEARCSDKCDQLMRDGLGGIG